MKKWKTLKSCRITYRCFELVGDGSGPEVRSSLRVDKEWLCLDLVVFLVSRLPNELFEALGTDEIGSRVQVVHLESIDQPARYGAANTFGGF